MWFLLTVIALLGVGILVALILILKKLASLQLPQIVVKNEQDLDLEDSVRGGMKQAIKELEHEKEEQELLMKRLDQQQRGAKGVYSLVDQKDEPINTGGFLIPAHLTEEEKELLRMFYNDQ